MTMTDERLVGGTTVGTVERTINRVVEAARADAVFGHPVEKGDMTVIPCAEIAVGLGMGGGTGSGTAPPQGEAAPVSTGQGEGAGGGGGGRGRPVAAIVITRDGVHIQPIVDVTRVALAGLTTGAFMLFWLMRLVGSMRAVTPAPAESPRALRRAIRRVTAD